MSLVSCADCGSEASEMAAFCPSCGSPHPSNSNDARAAWRELRGPSFGSMFGSAFLALLAWSLIPLAIWIFGMMVFGTMMRSAAG